MDKIGNFEEKYNIFKFVSTFFVYNATLSINAFTSTPADIAGGITFLISRRYMSIGKSTILYFLMTGSVSVLFLNFR